MNTSFLLVLASMTASSALELSASERIQLTSALDQWKKSAAGQLALDKGLLPPKAMQESLSKSETNDIELKRFAATQKVVAALNKAHPQARFSTNNPFALLSQAEFASYVKGSFGRGQGPTPRQLRHATKHPQLPKHPKAHRAASGEVDWSTHTCMPKVKNQGQCGSCWTFSTVGAAEIAHCLATGSLVEFSQQQLVSCAKDAGYGCSGGYPDKALDYIYETGLCTLADYPYTSGNTSADGTCTECAKTKLSIGKPVTVSGEAALESALPTQAVAVIVEAGNDVWRNYVSGVVQSCPGAPSDHAVLAVGYGTKDGVQHFKIKNSWGDWWGEKGYMYLQRGVPGKGMCNVAEAPAYPPLGNGPHPTQSPTDGPTTDPTHSPTDYPTDDPTDDPTEDPTEDPTDDPTSQPQDCHGCKGCYYPPTRQCLTAEYHQQWCESISEKYGAYWCGP